MRLSILSLDRDRNGGQALRMPSMVEMSLVGRLRSQAKSHSSRRQISAGWCRAGHDFWSLINGGRAHSSIRAGRNPFALFASRMIPRVKILAITVRFAAHLSQAAEGSSCVKSETLIQFNKTIGT